MGRKCCVQDCNSNYDALIRLGHATISTFKFPDHPEIRERWIRAINRGNGWSPSQTASICINHFQPEDILRHDKPAKLRPIAVPSIFGKVLKKTDDRLAKRGRPKKSQTTASDRIETDFRSGDVMSDESENLLDSSYDQLINPAEDLIHDFENLIRRLREKSGFGQWQYYRSRNVLHFYNIHDESNENAIKIMNSIKIFDDLRISLFLREVKQANDVLRWILGDSATIHRWSQLETILQKYDEKNLNIGDKILHKEITFENDDGREEFGTEEYLYSDEDGPREELYTPENGYDITTKSNTEPKFIAPKEIEFMMIAPNEECNSDTFPEKHKRNPLEGIVEHMAPQTGSNERRKVKETIRILKNTKHKCFICNREHETSEAFEQHVIEHIPMLPYRCDHCVHNEVTIKTLASLNKHFLMHLKPLKCRLCDVRFSSYGTRLLHEQNSHENRGPVSCEVCGKVLRSLRGYKHHFKIHSNPEAMKCQLCFKQLSSEYELKLHMRIHTKEKLNKCPFCTASFNRVSNLFEHKRRFHFKLRPFVCLMCKKDFSSSDELKNHVASHDTGGADKISGRIGLSEQNEYYCKMCNKRMQTASSYHSHMRKHRKQYQCSYCGIRIGQLRDFIDHENTHTDARPYQCEVCLKKFRTSSTYYGHRAVHSAMKRFPCKVCGRRFSRLRHFTLHSKIHSPTEKQKPHDTNSRILDDRS